MVDALIIDACRTPRGIGKAGKGALSGIHPQQLGATVLRALADRTGIDTADVDDIIWGTSSQRGRRAAIWVACRRSTPAMTCAPVALRWIYFAAPASPASTWQQTPSCQAPRISSSPAAPK